MHFIVAAAAIYIAYIYLTESHIVYQYQKGLRFNRGRLHSILGPGKYTFYRFANSLVAVDMRKRVVPVPGQEILTADNICLKITVEAVFEVSDPEKAVTAVEDYHSYLYSGLHAGLRAITGTLTSDELLAKRNEIGAKLLEATRPAASDAGINLIDARVRDISFPGEIKAIFARVVAAQKEGLALLERARGESAALRNLANSAKMLDENPNLLQLRLIQELGQSSGHTVIIGATGAPAVIKKSADEK